MYRFWDLLLTLGVTIFFLGGIGLAFGYMDKNSALLPLSAVSGLILIGVGGFFKKRAPK